MAPVTRSQIKSITQALNTPRSSQNSPPSSRQSSSNSPSNKSNQNSSKFGTSSSSSSSSSCSCSSCSCDNDSSSSSSSSSQQSRERIRSRSPIARSQSNSSLKSEVNVRKNTKSGNIEDSDNDSPSNSRRSRDRIRSRSPIVNSRSNSSIGRSSLQTHENVRKSIESGCYLENTHGAPKKISDRRLACDEIDSDYSASSTKSRSPSIRSRRNSSDDHSSIINKKWNPKKIRNRQICYDKRVSDQSASSYRRSQNIIRVISPIISISSDDHSSNIETVREKIKNCNFYVRDRSQKNVTNKLLSCGDQDSNHPASSSKIARDTIHSPIIISPSNSSDKCSFVESYKNITKNTKSRFSLVMKNTIPKKIIVRRFACDERVYDHSQERVCSRFSNVRSRSNSSNGSKSNENVRKSTKCDYFLASKKKFQENDRVDQDFDNSASSIPISQDRISSRSSNVGSPSNSSNDRSSNVTDRRSSTVRNAGARKKVQKVVVATKVLKKILETFDRQSCYKNYRSSKMSSSSSQPNSVRTYSSSYEDSSSDSGNVSSHISDSKISGSSVVGKPNLMDYYAKKAIMKNLRPSAIRKESNSFFSENRRLSFLSTSSADSSFSVKSDHSFISREASQFSTKNTINLSDSSNDDQSFTPKRKLPSPRTIRRNSLTNLFSMRGSPVSNVRSLLSRRYMVFACPEESCNLISTQVRTVTEHHKFVHPKRLNLYHCLACREKFSSKEVLDIHRIGEHNEEITCTLCNCMYAAHPFIEEHAYMHLKKQFKCDTCSTSFVGQSYLTAHIKAVNRKQKPFDYQPHTANICTEKKIHILEKYERRDTKLNFNLPGDLQIKNCEPASDVNYLKAFCKTNNCYYVHNPWRVDLE